MHTVCVCTYTYALLRVVPLSKYVIACVENTPESCNILSCSWVAWLCRNDAMKWCRRTVYHVYIYIYIYTHNFNIQRGMTVWLYCCPTLSRVTTKTLPSWFHTSWRQGWCTRLWKAQDETESTAASSVAYIHAWSKKTCPWEQELNWMNMAISITERWTQECAASSGSSSEVMKICFLDLENNQSAVRNGTQSMSKLYIFTTSQCICGQDKDISPRLSQPLLHPLI